MPVLVNPKDKTCWQCQGQLNVVDADDCSLTVDCLECEETFQVETDALNDGAIVYWPRMMAELEGDF